MTETESSSRPLMSLIGFKVVPRVKLVSGRRSGFNTSDNNNDGKKPLPNKSNSNDFKSAISPSGAAQRRDSILRRDGEGASTGWRASFALQSPQDVGNNNQDVASNSVTSSLTGADSRRYSALSIAYRSSNVSHATGDSFVSSPSVAPAAAQGKWSGRSLNCLKCCYQKKKGESWISYFCCFCCGMYTTISSAAKQRSTSNFSGHTGSSSSNGGNYIVSPRNPMIRLLCPCLVLSRRTLHIMDKIVKSRFWGAVIVILTIVLLFGSQVQDLFCPIASDVIFDVIFTTAFVVLLVDIALRCFVSPQYFMFQLGKRSSASVSAPGPSASGSGGDGSSGVVSENDGWCGILIGSFMFWCDLISTLTLLWDISFVNPRAFDMLRVDIGLDEYGIPISGMDKVNDDRPFEVQPEILIAIGRTVRVARFICASTVVKTSAKVNWYWIPQHLNPFFWFDTCLGRIRSFDAGGLEQKKAEARKSRENMPILPLKRIFACFGMLSRVDEEARRNDAAITIQRAWLASTSYPGIIRNMAAAAKKKTYDAEMAKLKTKGRYVRGTRPPVTKPSIAMSVKQTIRRTGSSVDASSSSCRMESQVGSAMRKLTGQRVALGIIIALILTVLFTYQEEDATEPTTMVVLHKQTQYPEFAQRALVASRSSSVPDLFQYTFVDGTTDSFALSHGDSPSDLRNREIGLISVTDVFGRTTTGLFDHRKQVRDTALASLVFTIFVLVIWFFGVTAFAGPVMTLVVLPIERMIRLLTMLMRDPLGYQTSDLYKKFMDEEDEFIKNTQWTKDVLKGMETSFLMSTILRIGSLMKVGFGSAGVEIIRNNLEKGQKKDITFKNLQGSTVSCIFLFCDIRQFTDATECLQEEVFVFTNKIAAVVHSICHSYGGSANKNVGDAFLLSWLLDDQMHSIKKVGREDDFLEPFYTGANLLKTRSNGFATEDSENLVAIQNQADKALLSVVKICIALYHDKFFLESMSEAASKALKDKMAKRKGPIVQMGFGLHAGKAVQGAIGSQRKLDATYVSESVELAEFLESSTKKFGLKLLMSEQFHKLLHQNNRRRCRKIDQIIINNEDDEDGQTAADFIDPDEQSRMELYTFDMDIDALWKVGKSTTVSDVGTSASYTHDAASDSEGNYKVLMSTNDNAGIDSSKRDMLKLSKDYAFSKRSAASSGTRSKLATRRRSVFGKNPALSIPVHVSADANEPALSGEVATAAVASAPIAPGENETVRVGTIELPELVLPSGPALYDESVWLSDDIRKIRQRYSDGLFFQKFNSGLQSFYSRDWEHARQCFRTILERFEDGPSRYFLNKIEENNGIPPRNFTGYGAA